MNRRRTCQEIGNMIITYLYHVWIKANDVNWGLKTFRVNKCWFEYKKFIKFEENEWKSIEVKGKQAYVMKEKFKVLRERLRGWNMEVFGWIDL